MNVNVKAQKEEYMYKKKLLIQYLQTAAKQIMVHIDEDRVNRRNITGWKLGRNCVSTKLWLRKV